MIAFDPVDTRPEKFEYRVFSLKTHQVRPRNARETLKRNNLRWFWIKFCVWGKSHDWDRDTGKGVVRALASHQCVPGSIPRLDFICGLSLLLVQSLLCFEMFLSGYSSLSLSSRNQHFQITILAWKVSSISARALCTFDNKKLRFHDVLAWTDGRSNPRHKTAFSK